MWLYELVMSLLIIDSYKLLKRRCLKNAYNKDEWNEIWDTAETFTYCDFQGPLRNDDDITDTLRSTCYQRCYRLLENAVNKIEPCFNLEEKYLPKFALYYYNDVVDMECGDGRVSAWNSAYKSANCTWLDETERKLQKRTYAKKLEHLKRLKEPDYVLTISDFCSDIRLLMESVVNISTMACGHNENLNGLIARDFKAALDLCNSGTSGNIATKFASHIFLIVLLILCCK